MKKRLINRSYLLKQAFFIMIFILIGINGIQSLSNHVKNQSVYMNILDYYNLLYINTQNPTVDYIDYKNPTTLLGIVTILILGAIYTSNHFVRFNKHHLYMVLIRYGSFKSYIFEMHRKSLKQAFIFTILLNTLLLSTVYIMDKSIFLIESSYSIYSIFTVFSFISIYLLILFLFILTISRLMIYVNLFKGSVVSILFGIAAPIAILIVDINQTNLNIILFDYEYYFIDSLFVFGILNFLISIISKLLIKKYEIHF